MGLFVIFRLLVAISCLSSTTLSAIEPSNRILYLMQTGDVDNALKSYQKSVKQEGRHNLELVQQLAVALLEKGSHTDDPETQLMTMFGAGISTNEKTLHILEEGIRSPYPQLQLICLNFLGKYNDDHADKALHNALNSNYLEIRLEGAYHLAQAKAPKAVAQIEALMNKVDPELWPIFPQLYAMIGNAESMKILRRLMRHPSEKVRIEAILSAAEYERDDLLPAIRILTTHHARAQQEACVTALGYMKDESSVFKIQNLTRSSSSNVRLAALQALYRLDRHEVRLMVEKAAEENDLFAISMLGQMPGSENTLFKLTNNRNFQVKVNATLALLELKDPRCLESLCEILVKDSRDLVFVTTSSSGGALKAYKAISSAQQNLKDDSLISELSLSIREEVLSKAVNLPEKDFLDLAYTLFEVQQHDLIPVLAEKLESMQSPKAIALLKRYQQKAGAPLIRNYCNLALYRLKEEGPYADNLCLWIASQQKTNLIQFRPLIPWEVRETDSPYQLTVQETSRLFIESLEALINNRDERGIDILLNAIQNGNTKNKYALAGLLIRASQ